MIIAYFICQIVFFYRIKKYNITNYDCSDSITNELIRKGIEDDSKQIKYITINICLDIFQVVINILGVIAGFILTFIDKSKEKQWIKEREKQREDKVKKKRDVNKNSKQNYSEIPLNTYYPE